MAGEDKTHRVLGKGGFGTVYLVQVILVSTNTLKALKAKSPGRRLLFAFRLRAARILPSSLRVKLATWPACHPFMLAGFEAWQQKLRIPFRPHYLAVFLPNVSQEQKQR